jgi:hypothetical protein
MVSWKATLLLFPLMAVCQGCGKSTVSAAAPAPAPNQINFLSIVVDADTAQADTRLKRFLEKAVAEGATAESGRRTVRFQQQTMPYGDVIRSFAEADPGRGYLARITPYAYVAAEMLGAKLNILAVYQSAATHETTYHSYFVVHKATFRAATNWKSGGGDASLEDVATYLRSFDHPPKFMYHDRFSTSSYFMPALYFKAHDVFAMSRSLNPHLIPIEVERLATTSSGDLVQRIVDKKADLVAVWDGTRKKWENHPDLLFIQIPTAVPNDFLVASGIDAPTEQLIVNAIRKHPSANRPCTDLPIPRSSSAIPAAEVRTPCAAEPLRPKDDFDAWYAWDSNDSEVTDSAREALAKLRQDARQAPTPVVVRVERDRRAPATDERREMLLNAYVAAAKEAVRLSGTEFVLEDTDLHKRVDMTWTLESTHDGALKLTSKLDSAFGKSEEDFKISFVDSNDLPRRIADLARSRLRRIRYVWPYEQKYAAVLRDLDFTPDQRVLVQKISWMDPARNEYEEDTPFAARIENNTDFSKLRLSDAIEFPRNPDGSFNFDPMSNIAYRVVIGRAPQAGWIWVVMPGCFIALFVFACAAMAVDLRRRQPPPRGLQQTYQRMVDTYHRPWREQEIEEGEILWCDPKYMDEFVKELKTAGSLLDVVQAGGCDFNFGPLPVRFSILMRVGSRLFKRRPQLAGDLVEAAGGGNVMALDTLIQFLVCRRRLSPFVGLPEGAANAVRSPATPLEWEALNDIASRHFQRLGICDKRVDANLGREHSVLSTVVSNHFRGVIKKATHDASLFRQTWTVREPGTIARLACERELSTALMLRNQNGSVPASRVQLEVNLPPGAVLSASSETPLRAWVFGKILNWSVEHGIVSLQVKPMAILRDYAHQH